MKSYKPYILAVFALIFTSSIYSVKAQLGGSNLLEYQYGNIPETDPSDLNTLYNQTNLTYKYKKLNVRLRLEQFYNSADQDKNYISLSQYHLKYSDKKVRLEVGTLYETLGRGLTLRTYEIKNSILEDRIYRVRKGFYRDLQGASFTYKGEIGQLKMLAGRPLDNQYPPGDSLSHTDFVSGVEGKLKLKKQKVGFTLIRNENLNEKAIYGSLFLDGRLFKDLSYYVEYASTLDKDFKTTASGEEYGHALYSGINYSFSRLGISFELRDYQNFFLGSGFTAPPTLVKEHTYKVLNRSTHVSDLISEKGVQTELFYMLPGGDLLTLNYAYTINDQFDIDKTFYEYFIEYSLSRFKTIKAKFFLDYSIDDLYLEKNRFALGAYLDKPIGNSSLSLMSEVQNFDRVFAETTNIWNTYNGLSYNYKSKFMISLFWEFSTDPNITDMKSTSEIETKRHFWGGQLNMTLNEKNKLSLFAGQRRGGPACSSGVCYEVLDFEGLEIRLNSRF